MPALALLFLVLAASLPFRAVAQDESPLKVTEMEICREIVDRECRGIDRSVGPEVEAVTFMTKVEGATGEAYIVHVWRFEGEEVRRLKLPVKGHTYRTWSEKRVKGLPGKWKAEVLDPLGRSLGSIDFVVNAPRTAS